MISFWINNNLISLVILRLPVAEYNAINNNNSIFLEIVKVFQGDLLVFLPLLKYNVLIV